MELHLFSTERFLWRKSPSVHVNGKQDGAFEAGLNDVLARCFKGRTQTFDRFLNGEESSPRGQFRTRSRPSPWRSSSVHCTQIKTDHGVHPSLSSRRASLVSRQHHVCRSAPRPNFADDGVGVSDRVVGCLGLFVTFTALVSVD